jgi:hypothetical protein
VFAHVNPDPVGGESSAGVPNVGLSARRVVPKWSPAVRCYRREAARMRVVVIDTMPLITAIIRLKIPDTSVTTMPIPNLHFVRRR